MSSDDFRIILVEDNPDDVEFISDAVREINMAVDLQVVDSGDKILDHLKEQIRRPHVLLPHLLMLDINLPVLDGYEVLHAIKTDEFLCSIPVITMSTSGSAIDAQKAYGALANAHIVKPLRPSGFVPIMQSLIEFWMNTAYRHTGA